MGERGERSAIEPASRRLSRSARWLLALVFAAPLALAASPHSAAQQDGAEGFSASERERLSRGRLIQRPTERHQGRLHLVGGSSFQVVDRPAAVVWRALCDTDAYRHMFPSTESARTVAHSPGQRVVRMQHRAGLVGASYHLRIRYDHGRRDISFRLDPQRPTDLRAAWGFISVAPYDGAADRSLVSFGAMADPGGGMMGGLVRGQIHDQILRIPRTIRDHVQSAAGERYVR